VTHGKNKKPLREVDPRDYAWGAPSPAQRAAMHAQWTHMAWLTFAAWQAQHATMGCAYAMAPAYGAHGLPAAHCGPLPHGGGRLPAAPAPARGGAAAAAAAAPAPADCLMDLDVDDIRRLLEDADDDLCLAAPAAASPALAAPAGAAAKAAASSRASSPGGSNGSAMTGGGGGAAAAFAGRFDPSSLIHLPASYGAVVGFRAVPAAAGGVAKRAAPGASAALKSLSAFGCAGGALAAVADCLAASAGASGCASGEDDGTALSGSLGSGDDEGMDAISSLLGAGPGGDAGGGGGGGCDAYWAPLPALLDA